MAVGRPERCLSPRPVNEDVSMDAGWDGQTSAHPIPAANMSGTSIVGADHLELMRLRFPRTPAPARGGQERGRLRGG